MHKKRQFKQKKKSKRSPRNKQIHRNNSREDSLYQQVLTLLYKTATPLNKKDIFKQLDLPLSTRKPLNKLLIRLTSEKILRQTDRDTYEPGPKNGLVEGTIDQNAKGFGFITPDDGGKDVFVHQSGLNDEISEGDKVSFDVQEGPKGLNAANVTLV